MPYMYACMYLYLKSYWMMQLSMWFNKILFLFFLREHAIFLFGCCSAMHLTDLSRAWMMKTGGPSVEHNNGPGNFKDSLVD